MNETKEAEAIPESPSRSSRIPWAIAAVATMIAMAVTSVAVTLLVVDSGDGDADARAAVVAATATTATPTTIATTIAASTTPPPTTAEVTTTIVVERTLPEVFTTNDGEVSLEEYELLQDAAVELGVSDLGPWALARYMGNITCGDDEGARDFSTVDSLFASAMETWLWVEEQPRLSLEEQPLDEPPRMEPWESVWWELASASFMCRDRMPSGIESIFAVAPRA